MYGIPFSSRSLLEFHHLFVIDSLLPASPVPPGLVLLQLLVLDVFASIM